MGALGLNCLLKVSREWALSWSFFCYANPGLGSKVEKYFMEILILIWCSFEIQWDFFFLFQDKNFKSRFFLCVNYLWLWKGKSRFSRNLWCLWKILQPYSTFGMMHCSLILQLVITSEGCSHSMVKNCYLLLYGLTLVDVRLKG